MNSSDRNIFFLERSFFLLLARLEYKVIVREENIARLEERVRDDQALNGKVGRIKRGEAIMRISVDVDSLKKRKEVEDLIRVDKYDIVGDCQVLRGARSEVEEKRSAVIAKRCARFFLSYAILVTNIIGATLANDYTKLLNGGFPWHIVLLVSIPSAIGSVISVEKTMPEN
jgi:hypothetical protein